MRLRNGLLTQSAYSVTGLARVRNHLGEIPLVRLRNPWGKGDWTGPWSERSWEWEGLNDRDKEILSTRAQNEGEFWMSFEDFVKNFTHLDLVHVSPDDWMNEPALQAKQPWRAVLARRRWRSGYNAGGSPIYIGDYIFLYISCLTFELFKLLLLFSLTSNNAWCRDSRIHSFLKTPV